MATTHNSVVLVGGPDAGKTNFLGRLWIALDAESGTIAKDGLPSDVEYLRAIASSLNAGEFAGRSAPGTFESTLIPVKWNGVRSNGRLIVPDCAGELWEQIHQDREWNEEWEQAVASMGGCILFFRVDSAHNVPPLNWSEHAEMMQCLKHAADTSAPSPRLPTQVVLTDWLQCLSAVYRETQMTETPLRVSVVLSAWDMAQMEAKEAAPDQYLNDQLPLLQDFLSGQPSQFVFKTFGVSIAGGTLSKEDTPFMKAYLNDNPNSKGYVVHSSGGKVVKSCDLTLPLAWALGCECPELS